MITSKNGNFFSNNQNLIHLQSGDAVSLLPTLNMLCASKKLDREKGEEKLRNTNLTPSDRNFLCHWIADKLEGLTNWEEVRCYACL